MVVRYNYLLGDLFGLARFLARGEGEGAKGPFFGFHAHKNKAWK